MTREQLLHVVRASAEICQENEFVIIGSQAVHGSLPNIDDDIVQRSMEADIYPLRAPEKTIQLNAIGLLSKFHDQYGYYADPVDDKTAVLPNGWGERVEVLAGPLTENRHGLAARAYCPELHDLAISKLVRSLEKDLRFFEALVRRGCLDKATILDRLRGTNVRPHIRRRMRGFIQGYFLEAES